jgi:hypothetical protein
VITPDASPSPMSDDETSDHGVRDMDDGEGDMDRDMDDGEDEETVSTSTHGPVDSPNMHRPGPSMPRDPGSMSPASSRSSNSSMAREERRMRQMFPDEFEDVPPRTRESPGQEDSKQSASKDETTSTSPEGTPEASPIPCPMSDDGVMDDGEEDETTTTSPSEGTPNSPTRIPHGIIRQFHEQDVRHSQHMIQAGGQQQAQLAEAEFLEQELARWYGRCWICQQRGLDEWHGLEDCPRPEGQTAQQWARQVQAQLRYDRYSGCFGCGLPQAICEQWVDNGRGQWVQDSNRGCQYPKGTVISMVAGMLHGRDGEIWPACMTPITR